MPPMSDDMQTALQINYDDHVKSAAQIYKKMLSQAKKIAQSPIPSHIKNCAEPFMVRIYASLPAIFAAGLIN